MVSNVAELYSMPTDVADILQERPMATFKPFTDSLGAFLDSLSIASLFLDPDGRMLGWNSEFLRLFPEQAGHIRKDEPYAENLRRFYSARLDATEMPSIESYVAAGVDRHFRQVEPFEFLHRGRWLRASVLPVPGVGCLRAWKVVRSPLDGERLAMHMAHSGKLPALTAMEEIPDGLSVRNRDGRIMICNRRFAEIYGLHSPEDAIGRMFSELLENACSGTGNAENMRQVWSDNSRFLGATFEFELPTDCWVRVRDYPSIDNSIASTHVDITNIARLRRSATEARRQAEELDVCLQLAAENQKQTDARTARIAHMIALGTVASGLRSKLDTAPVFYVKGVVDHVNRQRELTYIATGPLTGVGLAHRRFREAAALVPGELVEIGRVDPQGLPVDWRPAPRCEVPGLFEKFQGRLERKLEQAFALITCATCVILVPPSLAAAFEPGRARDVSCWAIQRANRNGTIAWRAVTPPCSVQTVTA